jgi:hypothetical protein
MLVAVPPQIVALLLLLTAWLVCLDLAAASLLSGYAWSLDTFVDYCWLDLTNLSIIIIVLLVVEVRTKQALVYLAA